MSTYDYLVVGAGLYGATTANLLHKKGYKVLVLESADVVGGSIYTKRIDDIDFHVYGAHIFHTSNKEVWDYVQQFAEFLPYVHTVLANYRSEVYHLPFNLNTFKEIFNDVQDSEDMKRKIAAETASFAGKTPQNLEEQAISMVGRTLFEKLIKEYTEKQWGTSCSKLPASIIKRIPMRYEANNNYFNDDYQGIPKDGYTAMIEKMLVGIEVRLGIDYLQHKEEYNGIASHIIFTGAIDAYYDYCYGPLEYRSLEFKTRALNQPYYQSNSVVNYTSHEVPYTRIIEHKYFNDRGSDKTIITEEYPMRWELGKPRYYPVNNEENNTKYQRYLSLKENDSKLSFGGRLGLYRYMDMDDTIEAAFQLVERLVKADN